MRRGHRSRAGTRRWLAAAVTGLVAATLVGTGAPVLAHPGPPSAVFDPLEVGQTSVEYDLTGPELGLRLLTHRNEGRIAVDLDIESVLGRNNTTEFPSALSVQDNTDNRHWDWRLNRTEAEFTTDVAVLRRAGLRLVDQEVYQAIGGPYFNGLFVANTEQLSTAYVTNMTVSGAANMYKLQRGHGRMPIDIEIYWDFGSGSYRYAMVFVDNVEKLPWRVRLLIDGHDALDSTLNEYAPLLRPLVIDGVRNGAEPVATTTRFAAIFVGNPNGRAWRVIQGATAAEFANWANLWRDEGYRPIQANRYETPDGDRYLGIWRQNSNRPDWTLKDDVTTMVQTELDSFQVPGISVAIIQDGEYRYLRGFGHAHIDPNVPESEWTDMDTRHVMRTASVAKAVTGTLYQRLLADTALEPLDFVSGYIPGLPAQHQQRIWQLIANRGCIPHTDELDVDFDEAPYATALAAAQEFWDKPLVAGCDPVQANGAWSYTYSTPTYTLAAAAFEGLLGDPFDQIVLDRMTDAYDLRTLRPVDPDANVRRATLYDPVFDDDGVLTGNEEITPGDLSWKTAGGGMESSVRDLARFGMKVINGEILTDAERTEMWTPPNLLEPDEDDDGHDYAYGWYADLDAAHPVASKEGNQAGARTYLRVYPDDNVVVAIMSNRDGGGHDMVQLGKDIGQLIMDDIDS